MMKIDRRMTAMLAMATLLGAVSAPLTVLAQEAGTAPAAPQAAPAAPATPAPPANNQLISITGLVMQPPYLAIRVGVAMAGALTSGVLWAVPSESSRENAKAVWETTTGGPWGWPAFLGTLLAPKRSE